MEKIRKSDQLYHLLLERLSHLADGETFPTLREIMQEYQVSQFTAAPALKRLQENGLIRSHVGRGTIVTRQTVASRNCRILYLRPDWPSLSIQAMEEAMREEAEKRKYHCEVLRYEISTDIYRRIPQLEADAVILDPVRFDHFTTEQLQILTCSVRPVVLCRSTLPVFKIKCVGSQLMETGITAANYLYRRGHRRIGVLFSEGRSYTMNSVVDTLLLCARTLGCEVTMFDAKIQRGIDSCKQTRAFLEREFRGKPDCSALFVCSYATACETLRFLQEQKISVPDEISLLSYGFDEDPGRKPFITAVDTPLDQQAKAVLDIIDHQLAGDLSFPGQINIPPEIREYQSVKTLQDEVK